MRVLAYLCPLVLAGCFLPVATGASEPATTVGHGKAGVAINGEAPTLDLIAKKDGMTPQEYTNTYGQSPAAAARFTLSYGITDDTDLELAAEGELWFFFFPIPTGGSIGFRHHIDTGDAFDVAFAARVGGVSAGLDYNDTNGSTVKNEASAEYASIQGVIQRKNGPVRPLVSLNLMPFHIKRTPGSDPVQKFTGLASSVTFGLMFVSRIGQFGPYVTLTNFESQDFSGGTFPSGGLMFAFRPDRNRHEPPPPAYTPPPYAAPPPMYPQQPYPPPGQPYPQQPQPYPAPAPAPAPAPQP
ncbi:MAG: hypothetical protein JO257_07000 [Deltaproteobacteria bacterium]|nr:hypothetical protein [Deltaproteobacteria bacterium]